jgi:prepilin-type N-terminal cleavage/methylation domain-containing protein
MMNRKQGRRIKMYRKGGFTLIELLVVIAILGMLMTVLLPSINKAKRSAQAVVCMTHQNDVGKSMMSYVADENFFPASYLYGPDPMNQPTTPQPPDGYYHWSHYLYDGGRCPPKSFE